MRRWIPIASAVIAVVLLLAGVVTNSWWIGAPGEGVVLFGTVKVGLRAVEVCVLDCQEVPFGRVTTGGGVFFKVFSLMTYFGAFVVAIALLIGVALREFQEVDFVARKTGLGAVFLFGFAILALFSFPGVIPGYDLSVGSSFYLTILGALGCAAVGFLRLGADTGVGTRYVKLDGPQPDAPASVKSPRADVGPRAQQTGNKQVESKQKSLSNYEMNQEMRAASLGSRSSQGAGRKFERPRMAGVSERGPTSTDKSREIMRFAAKSIEIDEHGISAKFEKGVTQSLRWENLAYIIARRMPPDPPFERLLFIDLVPRPPEKSPIRLLASTMANWNALPGQPEVNSRENMRRLGAWLAERDQSLVEPDSVPFFLQRTVAPMFPSIKHFMEYDQQYE